MAMLMIKCPRTGQDAWTGILTDSDSFQRIPDTLVYTRCPHCGLDHAWWHKDAWLAEERPPSRASTSSRCRHSHSVKTQAERLLAPPPTLRHPPSSTG